MRALPSSPLIYLYNSIYTVCTHGCSLQLLFILCPDPSDPDLTIGSPLQLCPVLDNILN